MFLLLDIEVPLKVVYLPNIILLVYIQLLTINAILHI